MPVGLFLQELIAHALMVPSLHTLLNLFVGSYEIPSIIAVNVLGLYVAAIAKSSISLKKGASF